MNSTEMSLQMSHLTQPYETTEFNIFKDQEWVQSVHFCQPIVSSQYRVQAVQELSIAPAVALSTSERTAESIESYFTLADLQYLNQIWAKNVHCKHTPWIHSTQR